MDGPPTTTPRRTSGGPVLQDEVTEAITAAFFAELADVGYGRLSLDAVARRAGAGKAAIYRRWTGKQPMTVALLSEVAIAAIDVPDTGTLHGDVRQYLATAREALEHPLVSRIVPDLLAEATRNPELAEALLGAVRTPRRNKAALLLQRAIDRGELPAGTDLETGLDLIGGPLYWRLIVIRSPIDDAYLDRLAARIVGGLLV
ncbi:TetR-like C-terminal domain-containing protein [Pseudonocardia sp. GCM10023141]|uniref:TetR-like C-terminal domain-containing protein n=1 Tax=Pseudonocardia sp. GCM10023141 TaxID=3252653 RepID=UPI00361EB825